MSEFLPINLKKNLYTFLIPHFLNFGTILVDIFMNLG